MFPLLPSLAQTVLLADAARRDLPTARRATLLALLLDERYLTREQLIARVEGRLGAGCFGGGAIEDNFYRDMRVVKDALRAADYDLRYSRSGRGRRGYYLSGQPPLSGSLADLLRGAATELDPQQLEVFRRLTPAERVRLGCSVTDAAVRAAAYRLRQSRPDLTLAGAAALVTREAQQP